MGASTIDVRSTSLVNSWRAHEIAGRGILPKDMPVQCIALDLRFRSGARLTDLDDVMCFPVITDERSAAQEKHETSHVRIVGHYSKCTYFLVIYACSTYTKIELRLNSGRNLYTF